MATYLMTWNGKRGHDTKVHELRIRATEFAYDRDKCPNKTTVNHAWSTFNQHVAIGDKIFLLMTGEGRGIIASGKATSEVYPDKDWRDPSKTSTYVHVEWDFAVPTDKRMKTPLLDDYGRRSGIVLDESVAAQVERLWAKHIRDVYGVMPVYGEMP